MMEIQNNMQIVTVILTFIFTSLGYFIWGRKKNNAEITKIKTESNKNNSETEMLVAKFYQEQLTDLLDKYRGLNERFELQEKEATDCELKYQELDKKYNKLLIEINLLKNNIKL